MATFEVRGTWYASSHGAYIPGSYDTERTARYAFRFPDSALAELERRICWEDSGEGRPITMDDLRAARAQIRPAPKPNQESA